MSSLACRMDSRWSSCMPVMCRSYLSYDTLHGATQHTRTCSKPRYHSDGQACAIPMPLPSLIPRIVYRMERLLHMDQTRVLVHEKWFVAVLVLVFQESHHSLQLRILPAGLTHVPGRRANAKKRAGHTTKARACLRKCNQRASPPPPSQPPT